MIIFLVLNFILAILLESKLKTNYTFELVVIVIGILLSIAMLLGMSFEANWSWPLATILFSLFLANSIYLYVFTSAFVAFTALVLVNTLGLLTSVLSIPTYDDYFIDAVPLETYETLNHPEVSYVTSTRTTKKKTTKKKKKK